MTAILYDNMPSSKPVLSASSTLFQEAQRLIPGGVNSPVRAFKAVGGSPFFIKSGSGAHLLTVDGHMLIDCVCAMGPAIHGHNHPYIQDAIQKTLAGGISFWMPHPLEVKMAQTLNRIVPSAQKVRFCNSGTEASMTAIRLARGYTKRSKIVKFTGSYHGHVDSLLVKAGSGASCLGCADSAGIPEGQTQDTLLIPFNDIYAVETLFKTYPEEIAGVIVEPYMGNCGLILPLPGFLENLRLLCTQHKAVLIFDEVMTGFRVSLGGVQAKTKILPDLTILAKIIGGGLPVGAVCGRADIMDFLAPLGPVYQAGTMSGNPLAMAAGLAALELLEVNNPYESLLSNTAALANALLDASKKKGIALQVPYTSGMFSIFFSPTPIRNYEDACKLNDTSLFQPFFQKCLKNGLFIAPSPWETSFISTAHIPALIERIAEILQNSILTL